MIEKIKHFFTKQLWITDFENLSKPKAFLLQQLRVIVLAYRGFKEDNILLRSSALTFYTLISIVPIIAMAFGIAKGFGFEEKLDKSIQQYFEHQQQVSDLLIEFSHSFLNNAKGGLVAGLGLIMLFWSVMKVLGNIELSFNAVWGIKTPRTLVRKFAEYLSIMLIAPVFIVLSSGLTILFSSVGQNLFAADNGLNLLGPIVQYLIKLSPYVLIWFLFTFIYVAIPNTKVKIKYALVAGIIAGSSFNILEWFYFNFQIGAVQYNAVYGSFAALPLFLVWVQSSWIIVLFGCEIAFAGQHVKRYEYEKEINNISVAHKKKITLVIIFHLNRHFNNGESAITANSFCEQLKLPIRLVQGILNDLIKTGIASEIIDETTENTKYALARTLNHLKISEIIALLETNGNNEINTSKKKEWDQFDKIITELNTEVKNIPSNITLLELEQLLYQTNQTSL